MNEIVKESYSITEVLRKLNKCPNSRNIKKLRNDILELGISIAHFTANGVKPSEVIKKVCPVCGEEFEVLAIGKVSKQVTCSHGCSNTYFDKQRERTHHRTICFRYHEKKCVICGESKIVAVHHYNHDDEDNTPSNLIPLCPTHHQYWHSRYRNEIKQKVDEYKLNFEKKQLTSLG